MLRKLSISLLCATSLFFTPAYSMHTYSLHQGLTLEFELPPNEPQLFVNYMFWEVQANCTIHTPDEVDSFLAEALAKKGKVNDFSLSKGDVMLIDVHEGDHFKLSAESGAKIQITNQGKSSVKAVCVA